MSAPRWLTPDTSPAETICRALLIPANSAWLAIVAGALEPLIEPDSFELFGTSSPQDTADVFRVMFDKFSFAEGVCRVVGEIIAFAGLSSPDARWLACDGASLLRSAYPDLFTVIGTLFGSADGTHFSLPDLQSRVPVGVGTGAGLSTYALGQQAGEENHTLTVAETPSHSHTDTGHVHTEGAAAPSLGAALLGVPIPSAIPVPGVTGVGAAALTNSGGGSAHNTVQPVLALNYLIVALP